MSDNRDFQNAGVIQGAAVGLGMVGLMHLMSKKDGIAGFFSLICWFIVSVMSDLGVIDWIQRSEMHGFWTWFLTALIAVANIIFFKLFFSYIGKFFKLIKNIAIYFSRLVH